MLKGGSETVSQGSMKSEAQRMASNPKEDFLRAVRQIGSPSFLGALSNGGQAWDEPMELKRFFVKQAFMLVGENPKRAMDYSKWQIEGLFPEAKELVYSKATENGCRTVGLAEGANERVLIITDNEKMELAKAFRDTAARFAGAENVFILNMDNEEKYGSRPFTGPNQEVFADVESFKPTVSFYIAGSKKGEVQFRIPLMDDILVGKLGCAHAHAPNLDECMMATGLIVDQRELVRITQGVKSLLEKTRKVRITSPAGTDVTYSLGGCKLISDEKISKGIFGNIPGAEVFTCPDDVNGKIVIDGILGDYFDKKYGLLKETPVKIEVRHGRAFSVSCKNKELEKELSEYLWCFKVPLEKPKSGNPFKGMKGEEGFVWRMGALNEFCDTTGFTSKHGADESTQIIATFGVKDGVCVGLNVQCKDPSFAFESDEKAKMAAQEIRNHLLLFINCSRIGELGIGTNIGLTELVGNLLQDEKFPSAHTAFGDTMKEETGAKWWAKKHIDGVMLGLTITLTLEHGAEVTIMRDGSYTDVITNYGKPAG